MDDIINAVVAPFQYTMTTHESQLKCFCTYGVQVEGWLKGEFLAFLENEKNLGHIVDFDREVKTGDGRKKVDFRIKISSETGSQYMWFELKHWLIGKQKGVVYYAPFYFGDPSTIGVISDVKKLAKVSDESRYILILTTANPGHDEWHKGISKFNEKFAPFSLEPLTKTSHFPDYYFLGLLRVVCNR